MLGASQHCLMSKEQPGHKCQLGRNRSDTSGTEVKVHTFIF